MGLVLILRNELKKRDKDSHNIQVIGITLYGSRTRSVDPPIKTTCNVGRESHPPAIDTQKRRTENTTPLVLLQLAKDCKYNTTRPFATCKGLYGAAELASFWCG